MCLCVCADCSCGSSFCVLTFFFHACGCELLCVVSCVLCVLSCTWPVLHCFVHLCHVFTYVCLRHDDAYIMYHCDHIMYYEISIHFCVHCDVTVSSFHTQALCDTEQCSSVQSKVCC